MDILPKTMSRLSSACQTTSYTSSTAESPHLRKLSYDEVKTPSTIDWLFALCAGSEASFRLERKRMLQYFKSIPGIAITPGFVNWADTIGGEFVGERDTPPNFRKSWAKPNSGITFRYRHHKTKQSTSCSTLCTTFKHQPYQPSVPSGNSSATTILTLLSPSIRYIPNGENHHILPYSYSILLHKSSFPAAVLPEVVKARENRSPLDLAGACAQIAREGTAKETFGGGLRTQLPIEDAKEERGNNENNTDGEHEELGEEQLEATAERSAQEDPGSVADPYFGSVRENSHVKQFLDENPSIFPSLTKEAKFEAWRAENRELQYQPPKVEDAPDEGEGATSKQRASVSSSFPSEAQIQAGCGEISKSHQPPSFLRKAAAAPVKLSGSVSARISRSEARLSGSKKSHQRLNSNTKQVRFAADPIHHRERYRSVVKVIPEEEYCQTNFNDILRDDLSHFKSYPNTYAARKDPTDLPPDKRRVNREPGFFVNTPWQMQPPRTDGHCREFIQQRDFNPLALRHTLDPEIARRKIAAREEAVRARRPGRPPGQFFVPPRQSRRPPRRYPRMANVKPVYRQGPNPGQPECKVSPVRGPHRRSHEEEERRAERQRRRDLHEEEQEYIEKYNNAYKEVTKDIGPKSPFQNAQANQQFAREEEEYQGCAIESTDDEDDWDPTCYVEPEGRKFKPFARN